MGSISDQAQPTFVAKTLLWTATAFLAVAPVIAVKSTSSGMRITWIGFLLMLILVGVGAHLRTRDDPEIKRYADLQRKGPFALRYRPILAFFGLGTLLVAEILSIAATHATPDRPLLWQGTMLIAKGGEAIFPIVGKYATQMMPALDPAGLYKAQAVTTLCLLAGALIFIALAPYVLFMPREERRFTQKVLDRTGYGSSSASRPLILLPFGILAGLAIFFGWLEFGSDPDHLTRKGYFIKAAWYVQDDLALFVASFFRIFGSYGFWLAALAGAIRAFDSDTE